MRRTHRILLTLTLMLLASALTCLILALTLGRELGLFNDRFMDIREYAALLRRIDETYIGDPDRNEVTASALRAAVLSLGDRWSYYLTSEEYEEYINSSNNRYTGIGVTASVDEETGGIEIQSIYKDSAASNAGLAVGDIITGVDGVSVIGTDLEAFRVLLSRQIGETAILTIIREAAGTLDIIVEYGYVFVDPVEYELLEGSVGYIALMNFDGGSGERFIEAVDQLIETGATSLIFDVRGNGGGRVSEMTMILDYLLPEGDIFVAVDKEGSEEIIVSQPDSIDIPSAVLINRHSYSAAEYFAATLSEYEYSVTFGQQTTGKSRSQMTYRLPNGGAIHISTGQYLTKNRVSLYDTGGLTPDNIILMTDEEDELWALGRLSYEDDPQLTAALDFLRIATDAPVN